MRILHMLDYGYAAGGAEISVQRLNVELARRGHDSRIFASSAGCVENPDKERIANYWCYGTTGRARAVNQSFNFRAATKLRRVLAEFRPDFVHLHMFLTQLSPLVLKEIAHLPVIHTAHWFRAVCLTGFKTLPGGEPCTYRLGPVCRKQGCVTFHEWLPLKRQMKMFNRYRRVIRKYIAISETVKSRLVRDGITIDRVIVDGIERLPLRRPLEGPPRVGFAARMVAGKGGFTLLDAFLLVLKREPESVLDIFGDGPCLSELRAHANNLGLSRQVRFHGYLGQYKMQQHLARVWVQVAPTMVDEPLGIVAIEAAMRGTAVVASDCGGFQELVEHGATGYLTPVGNPSLLANALLDLLSDKSRAERFGRAGRVRAKRLWTVDVMVDRYLEVYQELIRQGDDSN